MQKLSKETGALLLPYEVLRARLDIRDFFSRLVVKQIYESTGQTLSLARLQLSERLMGKYESIAELGMLIEQVVKEMRLMGRNFYPDKLMLLDEGMKAVVAFAASQLFRDSTIQIVSEKEVHLEETTQLILIKIILDALTLIREKEGQVEQIFISQNDPVLFTISYQSNNSLLFENQDADTPYLSVEQRMNLLNGCFKKKIINAGHYQLILQVPKTKQL